MHGGALGDVDAVIGFASSNDDGVSSAKEAVLGSQIVLPGGDEMRNTLLKELAIDLDLCHRDWRWGRLQGEANGDGEKGKRLKLCWSSSGVGRGDARKSDSRVNGGLLGGVT